MTEQKTEFEQWWNEINKNKTLGIDNKNVARAAWNEATSRAAKIAEDACLVPPDGGSPTEEEYEVCQEAKRRILSYNT